MPDPGAPITWTSKDLAAIRWSRTTDSFKRFLPRAARC